MALNHGNNLNNLIFISAAAYRDAGVARQDRGPLGGGGLYDCSGRCGWM